MVKRTLVGTVLRRTGTPLLLIAAALVSAGCSQSITVPINLVNGFMIPDLGGILAGDPIPEDLNIPPLPICAPLPSRAYLEDLFAGAVGPLLAQLLHIESIELVDTTLTATAGNFKDITFFAMYWQPSPVLGDPQPEVDLGSGSSTGGLDSPLVLTPPDPVDFLGLLDIEAGNPEGECPALGVRVQGLVPAPEDMPTISMGIRIRITGRLGI